jgi:aromatic-amino-acid transaminase
VDRAGAVLARRQLLPYLDLAYQGYGDGIDEDALRVRALLASVGLTFFMLPTRSARA